MVSSAEPVQEWFNSNTSVNKVNDMSAEHLEGVNGSLLRLPNPVIHKSQTVTSDIPDASGSSCEELESVTEGMDMPTKFWEIESNNPDQVTDVQGRLKIHISFWQDVLQTPPLLF